MPKYWNFLHNCSLIHVFCYENIAENTEIFSWSVPRIGFRVSELDYLCPFETVSSSLISLAHSQKLYARSYFNVKTIFPIIGLIHFHSRNLKMSSGKWWPFCLCLNVLIKKISPAAANLLLWHNTFPCECSQILSYFYCQLLLLKCGFSWNAHDKN